MTHEDGVPPPGGLATAAPAVGGQPQSMTADGKRIFDNECAAYDLEVEQAKSALLRMIGIMPSPGTEQDAETRAAIYWDVLKGELSPSAIARVCKRALAGDTGSAKWLPMPGELIRFARDNWIQCGPAEIDPRLRAPVQSRLGPPEHKRLGREYGDAQFMADEQARLARQWKNFAAEMARLNAGLHAAGKPDYTRRGPPVYSRAELAAMNDGEREKQRLEAEAWLDENRNKPLPLLSAELRDKLGIEEVAAE